MDFGFSRFGACFLVVCSAVCGQAQRFEVASVKPNNSASGISGATAVHGRYTGTNLSLKSYIRMAYAVSEFQVTGPAWIDSDRYDINAKGSDLPGNDWYRPMLQALLADRFKLRLHRETRPATVYQLTVAPRGLKAKEADPSGDSGTDNGRGRLTVLKSSMGRFAEVLSRQTDYPVVDRTNLPGLYDFVLEWTPEEAHAAGDSAPPPSLFTAIQEQLGLKLQSGKVPIEFLAVQGAERLPTEN
jgi:uncharacterized protein (TIGR03435 family)